MQQISSWCDSARDVPQGAATFRADGYGTGCPDRPPPSAPAREIPPVGIALSGDRQPRSATMEHTPRPATTGDAHGAHAGDDMHEHHGAHADHGGHAGHGAHDTHAGDAGHGGHAAHDTHAGHAGHGAHGDHGDHAAAFRDKFWVSLALAIPVVGFSP